jgi:hypothetical protein
LIAVGLTLALVTPAHASCLTEEGDIWACHEREHRESQQRIYQQDQLNALRDLQWQQQQQMQEQQNQFNQLQWQLQQLGR